MTSVRKRIDYSPIKKGERVSDDIIAMKGVEDEAKAYTDYMKRMMEADDPQLKAALEDIADEELLHLGEFLKNADPKISQKIEEGKEEAEENMSSGSDTESKTASTTSVKKAQEDLDEQLDPYKYQLGTPVPSDSNIEDDVIEEYGRGKNIIVDNDRGETTIADGKDEGAVIGTSYHSESPKTFKNDVKDMVSSQFENIGYDDRTFKKMYGDAKRIIKENEKIVKRRESTRDKDEVKKEKEEKKEKIKNHTNMDVSDDILNIVVGLETGNEDATKEKIKELSDNFKNEFGFDIEGMLDDNNIVDINDFMKVLGKIPDLEQAGFKRLSSERNKKVSVKSKKKYTDKEIEKRQMAVLNSDARDPIVSNTIVDFDDDRNLAGVPQHYIGRVNDKSEMLPGVSGFVSDPDRTLGNNNIDLSEETNEKKEDYKEGDLLKKTEGSRFYTNVGQQNDLNAVMAYILSSILELDGGKENIINLSKELGIPFEKMTNGVKDEDQTGSMMDYINKGLVNNSFVNGYGGDIGVRLGDEKFRKMMKDIGVDVDDDQMDELFNKALYPKTVDEVIDMLKENGIDVNYDTDSLNVYNDIAYKNDVNSTLLNYSSRLMRKLSDPDEWILKRRSDEYEIDDDGKFKRDPITGKVIKKPEDNADFIKDKLSYMGALEKIARMMENYYWKPSKANEFYRLITTPFSRMFGANTTLMDMNKRAKDILSRYQLGDGTYSSVSEDDRKVITNDYGESSLDDEHMPYISYNVINALKDFISMTEPFVGPVYTKNDDEPFMIPGKNGKMKKLKTKRKNNDGNIDSNNLYLEDVLPYIFNQPGFEHEYHVPKAGLRVGGTKDDPNTGYLLNLPALNQKFNSGMFNAKIPYMLKLMDLLDRPTSRQSLNTYMEAMPKFIADGMPSFVNTKAMKDEIKNSGLDSVAISSMLENMGLNDKGTGLKYIANLMNGFKRGELPEGYDVDSFGNITSIVPKAPLRSDFKDKEGFPDYLYDIVSNAPLRSYFKGKEGFPDYLYDVIILNAPFRSDFKDKKEYDKAFSDYLYDIIPKYQLRSDFEGEKGFPAYLYDIISNATLRPDFKGKKEYDKAFSDYLYEKDVSEIRKIVAKYVNQLVGPSLMGYDSQGNGLYRPNISWALSDYLKSGRGLPIKGDWKKGYYIDDDLIRDTIEQSKIEGSGVNIPEEWGSYPQILSSMLDKEGNFKLIDESNIDDVNNFVRFLGYREIPGIIGGKNTRLSGPVNKLFVDMKKINPYSVLTSPYMLSQIMKYEPGYSPSFDDIESLATMFNEYRGGLKQNPAFLYNARKYQLGDRATYDVDQGKEPNRINMDNIFSDTSNDKAIEAEKKQSFEDLKADVLSSNNYVIDESYYIDLSRRLKGRGIDIPAEDLFYMDNPSIQQSGISSLKDLYRNMLKDDLDDLNIQDSKYSKKVKSIIQSILNEDKSFNSFGDSNEFANFIVNSLKNKMKSMVDSGLDKNSEDVKAVESALNYAKKKYGKDDKFGKNETNYDRVYNYISDMFDDVYFEEEDGKMTYDKLIEALNILKAIKSYKYHPVRFGLDKDNVFVGSDDTENTNKSATAPVKKSTSVGKECYLSPITRSRKNYGIGAEIPVTEMVKKSDVKEHPAVVTRQISAARVRKA